jgi:hypothetical protein
VTIAIVIAAIVILAIILWLLIQNIRMRSKISNLRGLYNGDPLNGHAPVSEWESVAQRGLEASQARRKNG